ncbi:unnamed protein product [Cylindrotheca closterium]|uniref:Uncharacterized protein n=1 Tax=Cylindrotheca closterium TaxID=2856 RepID=A0AAD2FWK2_9STRA|nr:unnamed protein product [Cylindrotheca closterium]
MVAELGQYVHAIGTDSNNLMEPQSIEAIYIEPTKGQCTGHRVLNLNTKKMISQPKVVVLPVTDQVIQCVEAWAAAKGVTSMQEWMTPNKFTWKKPWIRTMNLKMKMNVISIYMDNLMISMNVKYVV